jgi:hypothetical protein
MSSPTKRTKTDGEISCYVLITLSISGHLTPNLDLAQEIKRRFPNKQVIFGIKGTPTDQPQSKKEEIEQRGVSFIDLDVGDDYSPPSVLYERLGGPPPAPFDGIGRHSARGFIAALYHTERYVKILDTYFKQHQINPEQVHFMYDILVFAGYGIHKAFPFAKSNGLSCAVITEVGWKIFRRTDVDQHAIPWCLEQMKIKFGYEPLNPSAVWFAKNVLIYQFLSPAVFGPYAFPDTMAIQNIGAFQSVALNLPKIPDFMEDIRNERKNGRKIVYVSLGSFAVSVLKAIHGPFFTKFYENVAKIVTDLGAMCICSTNAADVHFEQVLSPQGMKLLRFGKYVPQLDILNNGVDVFVAHGGWGSFNEAMYSETPPTFLVLPLFGDQFGTAMRIVELGMGNLIKTPTMPSLSSEVGNALDVMDDSSGKFMTEMKRLLFETNDTLVPERSKVKYYSKLMKNERNGKDNFFAMMGGE